MEFVQHRLEVVPDVAHVNIHHGIDPNLRYGEVLRQLNYDPVEDTTVAWVRSKYCLLTTANLHFTFGIDMYRIDFLRYHLGYKVSIYDYHHL